MNDDMDEEIEYLIDTLTKSGFFSPDETMEILEEQFIGENVDFSQYNFPPNTNSSSNFTKLEKAFNLLSFENIIAIHNCGYDVEEGVGDVFELYAHLKNNNCDAEGFCFYTFEDVEYAIYDSKLKIMFGDFDNNKKKALNIGKTVCNTLKDEDFKIQWDETINTQIEIEDFKWDKRYDSNKNYETDGAYESYIKNR